MFHFLQEDLFHQYLSHEPPFLTVGIMRNYGFLRRFYEYSSSAAKIKNCPLHCRQLHLDYVPRDSKSKPKKYKYPSVYDPYGPRPPPSEKIVQLAERIAALPPEERQQIGPTLREKLRHPKMQAISSEDVGSGANSGSAGSAKVEEKKAEKTAFDVKLEKFDTAAKIKVIKEVRAFTNLGLKEAKDLVEKAPVLLKQGVTKEEANDIIEKIKAAGGVAVME
ncbi:hypothetical protein H6P81_009888 [Aristolochia fimbriata]|uniref:Large ribosomal subunit protein bL12 C-terminal domain-containing protein n=1 Tax=Aristolochia fimbriata TaxID=158543 RepID=A0AAV7EMB3_ARIFI|nr:hypothetical protein H6P81_009888 [Aristolochia fimbriata]